MTSLADKEYFTTDDVAALLQVSRPTAFRRLAEMQAMGLGKVGRGRFPADEVRRLLRELAHEEGRRRR